jgi:hypothetical protein
MWNVKQGYGNNVMSNSLFSFVADASEKIAVFRGFF